MSQKSTETVESSTTKKVSLSVRFVIDGEQEKVLEVMNAFTAFLKEYDVRLHSLDSSFNNKVGTP